MVEYMMSWKMKNPYYYICNINTLQLTNYVFYNDCGNELENEKHPLLIKALR